MGKEKDKIHKIPVGRIGRGLSLMGMTLASGSSLAALKIKQALTASEDENQKIYQEFLEQQAKTLVRELGKLKGSVMKAGQMLSVYGEHFFSAEVNKILKSLQADSTPLSWDSIEKVLKKQLDASTLQKLDIDQTPIAAASLGQVFRAKHKDHTTELILKVQYPGVAHSVDSDLKALKQIFSISKFMPKSHNFDEIFNEVRMMLHYEINYLREMENIKTYTTWLKDDPRYIIPTVFPEICSKRLLVMSYEPGLALDSPTVLALPQQKRNELGSAFIDLALREMFTWHTVQTDPHFGNYRIRQEGDSYRIILFDFGAVRHFSKRYMDLFAELAKSSIEKDRTLNKKVGLDIGFLRADDPEAVSELFAEICFTAARPFLAREPELYDWTDPTFHEDLRALAKNAVFTFRLRPPPREAIFLDRKMVGTYTLLKTLGLQSGSRATLERYLG